MYSPSITRTSLPPVATRGQIWAPAAIVYFTAGMYAVFSSYFPDALRLPLAGLIALFLFAAAPFSRDAFGWVHVQLNGILLVVLAIVLLGSSIFVHDTGNLGNSVAEIIRALAGLSALVYFSSLKMPILPKVKLFVYMCAVLTACLLTLVFGPYQYGGSLRPYPYHFGEDAIHPSGYVIAAAFLGVVVMRLQGEIGRATAWLLGLPLFGLVFAYQVRTSWVMLAIFFAVLAGRRFLRSVDRRVVPALVAIACLSLLVILPFLLLLVLPSLDLETFSSGRTATYLERIDILSQRSAVELLLGSGLGTDSFYSSSWWWEPKDSHNDYLHILIEQGFVGLGLVIGILVASIWRATPVQAGIVLSVACSSGISNGLLDRPMPAILYLGLMAPAMIGMSPRLGTRHPTPVVRG